MWRVYKVSFPWRWPKTCWRDSPSRYGERVKAECPPHVSRTTALHDTIATLLLHYSAPSVWLNFIGNQYIPGLSEQLVSQDCRSSNRVSSRLLRRGSHVTSHSGILTINVTQANTLQSIIHCYKPSPYKYIDVWLVCRRLSLDDTFPSKQDVEVIPESRAPELATYTTYSSQKDYEHMSLDILALYPPRIMAFQLSFSLVISRMLLHVILPKSAAVIPVWCDLSLWLWPPVSGVATQLVLAITKSYKPQGLGLSSSATTLFLHYCASLTCQPCPPV